MARAPSKRVVLNLRELDRLQFAVAVGLEYLGQGIIERATPPDDPSTPTSIAKTGGYVVLNGSRKVGGDGSKPRGFDTKRKGIISVVSGYGSPLAHLHERGTLGRVQETTGRFTGALPARPFLLPGTVAAVKELGPAIGRAIQEAGVGQP